MSDYNSIQDREMRELLKQYMMEQDENNVLTQKLIEMEAKLAFGLTPVGALVIPGEKEMLGKLTKGAIGKTGVFTWITAIVLTATTGLGIYALTSKNMHTNPQMPATPVKEKNTVITENEKLIASTNTTHYNEPALFTGTDTTKHETIAKTQPENTGNIEPKIFKEPDKTTFFKLDPFYKTGNDVIACMSEDKAASQANNEPGDDDKKEKKKNKRDKNPAPPVPPAPPGPPSPPAPPAPCNTTKAKKDKHKDGETKTESHTISDTSFAGIKKIVVNSGVCDLKITRSADETTRLKCDILIETKGVVTNRPEYKVRCEKSGEILKIWIENEEKGDIHVIGMLNIDANITMEVPAVTDAEITNESGDIDMSGFNGKTCKVKSSYGDIALAELGHEIELESQSGDITLTSCKGKTNIHSNYGDISVVSHMNSMDIESTSGDISITGMADASGKECNIKSNYGNVGLKGVKVPVKLKVQSGDVRVEDGEGNLDIHSGYGQQHIKNVKGNLLSMSTSGDVHVEGLTGDIRIQSSYGNVTTNDCVGDIRISAVSGNIKGKNIKVNTGMDLSATYGDIKMQLAHVMDELSFDLLASMGDIKVRKAGQVIVGEEGKLQIQKGKINVKALTTSGSQLFE
ncbi:MAG TPA: DUF4097 family beta strand repeat-containing protein [Flavobacteriales bacterium]|nr:DUF4097 family beta strand repeat-containing protein [Flavobacteriales bacterium]